MIYSIAGNGTNIGYDKSESQLAQAYDIEKNPLLTSTIRVMSYNYQWCTKLNSQLALQTAIINEYHPTIIGLQEAGANNRNSNSFPSLATQFLAAYTRKLSNQATNRNGLATLIPYSNYSCVRYTEYDDEYWDYQKCYIEVGGQTIAWFNTHLTWRQDAETLLRKYAQAAELFAAVEAETYAIVTGDFNMYGLSLTSDDYIGIGKQFADAGYNLANWTPDTFVKTWTDLASASSLDQFSYACDNIITTPNIEIANVIFDTTKFDYLNGQPIDHIPVVADLIIH